MIDPRTEYIIHKEKESNLMAQIERKLAAQERGKPVEISRPWYTAAEQWLKEKFFSRKFAESPCPGEEVPC